MPLWLQILFGAACIATIGNACLHAYALISERNPTGNLSENSAGRQITITLRKLKVIVRLIPRMLFDYDKLKGIKHLRSTGLFWKEKQAFMNAISYYRKNVYGIEGKRVGINSDKMTLDFNSRAELFKFVGAIYRIDPESGIEGSDGNGLRMPSSLLNDIRFSPVVEAAKGTYTVRPDNRPKTIPGVHDLVAFCEAKIDLLPF